MGVGLWIALAVLSVVAAVVVVWVLRRRARLERERLAVVAARAREWRLAMEREFLELERELLELERELLELAAMVVRPRGWRNRHWRNFIFKR